ncbi:MAG: disulfide bond formation protein B [Rhodoferax sp.]
MFFVEDPVLFGWSVRRWLAGIGVACVLVLAFGLYLQEVKGLEPCPMCIVQRYAFIFIAACALLASTTAKKSLQNFGLVAVGIGALAGAGVAARQSWLQWYPPAVASCGRDFYSMIEDFPLSRAIPMIFRGSGDCSAVDWTFLGGSIANWAFIVFVVHALLAGILLARGMRRH